MSSRLVQELNDCTVGNGFLAPQLWKNVTIKQIPDPNQVLYNWLIWRVVKLAFFFQNVFSLYLFWPLEQSEQRHLYVDIFLCYP